MSKKTNDSEVVVHVVSDEEEVDEVQTDNEDDSEVVEGEDEYEVQEGVLLPAVPGKTEINYEYDEEIESPEQINKQIFDLRSRGMSWTTIKQVLNLTGDTSVVQRRYQRHISNHYKRVLAGKRSYVVGGILAKLERLEQVSMINMSLAPEASAAKLHWLESAAKRLKERVQFIQDFNLVPKDDLDFEALKRRVKKMTDTEINLRMQEIAKRLANSQSAELALYDENLQLRKEVEKLKAKLSEK
jgi:hypothetical protein